MVGIWISARESIIMGSIPHLLALDQGTTSSRAIVFNLEGQVVSVAQEELPQIYPKPGWVEHDPFEIWSTQNATALGAISRANLSTSSVAALGLTNQRETTVVWDRRTGQPVYNAIVWQDRRTADFCRDLARQGLEPEIAARTGLRLDPYFSATKIRWILDHVSGARRRALDGHLLFGTVDTWIIWQLTGGRLHATDPSKASRTLLYNLHSGEWDPDLLQVFGIPRALLPEIRPTAGLFAPVAPNLYPAGVPITGVAGDQQAALFGQSCFSSGMAKCTYGTGCFLLMHTGGRVVPSRHNLLSTVAWSLGGTTEYALEGSVFAAGAVVQWMRDELQLVRSASELDALAASVAHTPGLFLVPAFSGLGAPHWDPMARGLAIGLTRGTNRAQFCRAALESIAFQTSDLIAAMEQDSAITLTQLRVDGGASRSDPLLQFQADLLGTPVLRPHCVETTALGASWLAGLGAGLWRERSEIPQPSAVARSFVRQMRPEEAMNARRSWQRAVERSLGWESGAPEGG